MVRRSCMLLVSRLGDILLWIVYCVIFIPVSFVNGMINSNNDRKFLFYISSEDDRQPSCFLISKDRPTLISWLRLSKKMGMGYMSFVLVSIYIFCKIFPSRENNIEANDKIYTCF